MFTKYLCTTFIITIAFVKAIPIDRIDRSAYYDPQGYLSEYNPNFQVQYDLNGNPIDVNVNNGEGVGNGEQNGGEHQGEHVGEYGGEHVGEYGGEHVGEYGGEHQGEHVGEYGGEHVDEYGDEHVDDNGGEYEHKHGVGNQVPPPVAEKSNGLFGGVFHKLGEKVMSAVDHGTKTVHSALETGKSAVNAAKSKFGFGKLFSGK